MAEVDTVFSIARGSAVYHIGDFNAIIASDFKRPGIRKKGVVSLERLLEDSRAASASARSVGRLEKFKLYQKMFHENVHRLNGKLPIMMTGVSVPEEEYHEKLGYDPFSNSFLITTKMLELARRVPVDFLRDHFMFWPISPVDFPFAFDEIGEESGIRHCFKEDVETLNKQIRGIGFGTLEKFDLGPKYGNYKFNESVFDASIILKRKSADPEGFLKNMKDAGFASEEEMEEYFRCQAIFTKELKAMEYAKFFDGLKLQKTLAEFNLDGVPLFAEKGSYATNVMERVGKYANVPYKIHFIGGSGGPMQNMDITRNGVAADPAMRRLFGFIESIYSARTGKAAKKVKIERKPERYPLELHSDPEYPFFLCEIPSCDHALTARDIIKKNVSEKELKYITEHCRERRVGFSRIEARIVELLMSDPSIYLGRRSEEKVNLKWQEELKGKIPVLPQGITYEDTKTYDLRGSELTNRDNDIERIITKIPRNIRFNILQEYLARNPYAKDDFFRKYDSENLESKPAIKGTGIHRVIGVPFPGLTHYKTLERVGLPPLPSSEYAETSFVYRQHGITVSLHPDAWFKLVGDQGTDIVVIDHKTNRKLDYPQRGYIDQTLFYGVAINENLRIGAKNLYLCIDYNAFDNKDPSIQERRPGSEGNYRRQQFVITKVPLDHPLIDYIKNEIRRTHVEQQELLHGNGYFREYLQEHHVKYEDGRMMTEWLLDKMGTEKPLMKVLQEIGAR